MSPVSLEGRGSPSTRKLPPHFDVSLISLLDSPFFPLYELEPEGGLPPTRIDDLPVESLLGRPGFVIIHVCGTAFGKLKGLRLFDVWSVRFLVVSDPDRCPLYSSHLRLTSLLNRLHSGSQRTSRTGPKTSLAQLFRIASEHRIWEYQKQSLMCCSLGLGDESPRGF
jgi:hypothetical protein